MAKNTERDKRMAKYLRENGIVRLTHRCPLCYRIVGNGMKHFVSCNGGK